MNAAQVLTAIGFDDDGRVQAWRFFGVPEEELLAIALERDFDQVGGHGGVPLLGVLAHGEELLAAAAHEFLRAEAA